METLEMNTETGNGSILDSDTGDEAAEDTVTTNAENTPEIENENESEEDGSTDAVDYGDIEKQDLEELRTLFPHLKGIESITELQNPLRYAALRDLGLTPREAYMATNEPIQRYDNRSHLRSSVPKGATAPSGILSSSELEAARELFSGLSDREIQKLYKKVSR